MYTGNGNLGSVKGETKQQRNKKSSWLTSIQVDNENSWGFQTLNSLSSPESPSEFAFCQHQLPFPWFLLPAMRSHTPPPKCRALTNVALCEMWTICSRCLHRMHFSFGWMWIVYSPKICKIKIIMLWNEHWTVCYMMYYVRVCNIHHSVKIEEKHFSAKKMVPLSGSQHETGGDWWVKSNCGKLWRCCGKQ